MWPARETEPRTDSENPFPIVRILWEDIPKPPATLVGKYRFREADGGHNNPFLPELGKAGTPYARTTPNLHPFPESLPDVGVIFDSLMRRDGFKPHPSGISSSLFAMAGQSFLLPRLRAEEARD